MSINNRRLHRELVHHLAKTGDVRQYLRDGALHSSFAFKHLLGLIPAKFDKFFTQFGVTKG